MLNRKIPKGIKKSYRWVYCPLKGDYVAFSHCMFACRHLREHGGMYSDDKILCGWDNSIRNIMRNHGEKPREHHGIGKIFKRKRIVKEA